MLFLVFSLTFTFSLVCFHFAFLLLCRTEILVQLISCHSLSSLIHHRALKAQQLHLRQRDRQGDKVPVHSCSLYGLTTSTFQSIIR